MMVTTLDNPYDPFDEFDSWHQFDEQHNYFTMNYIARVANTSHELTNAQMNYALNEAVQEIVQLDVLGIYTLVRRENS